MQELTAKALIEFIRDYAQRANGNPDELKSLGADSDLSAFGLDSIDVVILAGEFEEAFGIAADPAAFFRLRCVNDIVAEFAVAKDLPSQK